MAFVVAAQHRCPDEGATVVNVGLLTVGKGFTHCGLKGFSGRPGKFGLMAGDLSHSAQYCQQAGMIVVKGRVVELVWRGDVARYRLMIDRKTMRSLLENMEHAAQETLQQDSAFYEALWALKREIDNDPLVQSTVNQLQAAGRSVFSSFVPHVKIRVRTEEGIFALPRPDHSPVVPAVERVGRLTQELRDAASAVIKRSRLYRELGIIVNAAVGASDRFEGIASEVESAGYEVLICLDLSAYAQVKGSAPAHPQVREASVQIPSVEPLPAPLSGSDRKFLKALRIRIDEN
jgi:hypothetical protein